MQPGLWECVERQPGLAAIQFDWQQLLGNDYARIERYLNPTNRKATTIPCRVGCTPWCRRRVVQHSSDHCVAICDEGDPKYVVDAEDLISHELNMDTVCRDLCGALKVEPAVAKISGLHQTWQCGFLKSRQGIRHPVFLSIQMEEHHLVEVALRLCAVNRTPQVLLLPTTRRMSEPARQVLESNQTAWLPLDRTVGWSADGRMMADVNLAELLAPAGQPDTVASAEPPPVETDDSITIERRALDDGVHWIVGGVDKGRLYTRSDAKKARILDTLYELIGRGWIPHATFIALTTWPADTYFGSSSETGRMQKQLNYLRGKLGVRIEFKKDQGVRFAENIIQSH
jgi:hypothetical protein